MNEAFACKVCGNTPNEGGELEHGRGCYVLSADGGGTEYIEAADTQLASYPTATDHGQPQPSVPLQNDVERPLQKVYAECLRCGERWKLCTLPMLVTNLPKRVQCPNCAAGGTTAVMSKVQAPRDGCDHRTLPDPPKRKRR